MAQWNDANQINITLYQYVKSVQIRTRKNSVFGYFSRSVISSCYTNFHFVTQILHLVHSESEFDNLIFDQKTNDSALTNHYIFWDVKIAFY